MLYPEFPRTLNGLVSNLGRMLEGPTGNHWLLIADVSNLKRNEISSVLKGHVAALLIRNNCPFDLNSVWMLWTETAEYRTIITQLERQFAMPRMD